MHTVWRSTCLHQVFAVTIHCSRSNYMSLRVVTAWYDYCILPLLCISAACGHSVSDPSVWPMYVIIACDHCMWSCTWIVFVMTGVVAAVVTRRSTPPSIIGHHNVLHWAKINCKTLFEAMSLWKVRIYFSSKTVIIQFILTLINTIWNYRVHLNQYSQKHSSIIVAEINSFPILCLI